MNTRYLETRVVDIGFSGGRLINQAIEKVTIDSLLSAESNEDNLVDMHATPLADDLLLLTFIYEHAPQGDAEAT